MSDWNPRVWAVHPYRPKMTRQQVYEREMRIWGRSLDAEEAARRVAGKRLLGSDRCVDCADDAPMRFCENKHVYVIHEQP